MKKKSLVRCEPPKKNNKSSSHWNGGRIKNEKYKKKFNYVNNDNKILYFYFLYMEKGYILLKNIVWECSLYYYISSKPFLVLQDIWNEVMKIQRPYISALVLWTSYFDPKYLAIDQVF